MLERGTSGAARYSSGNCSEAEDRYRVLVERQIEAMCRWLPDTTLTYVSEGSAGKRTATE